MLSKEDYTLFEKTIESITKETFVEDINDDDLNQYNYFIQSCFWPSTEEFFYAYDKRKIPYYKKVLLALCKKLPKLHEPCEHHAGTISCFDLIMDFREHPELSSDDIFYQISLSNHFANLLSASNIASVHFANVGENKAYLIAIDPKYREYMEKDGIEPFDD